MIIVQDDDDMSNPAPAGGLSIHPAQFASGQTYMSLRDVDLQINASWPRKIGCALTRAIAHAGTFATGGPVFEPMGFCSVGPVNGHHLDHLLPIPKNPNSEQSANAPQPILVQAVTKKGKGYAPVKASADKTHGVVKLDGEPGIEARAQASAPSLAKVSEQSLIQQAAKDDRIFVITAAMRSGMGLDMFPKRFTACSFDVGTAKPLAVTFAARPAVQSSEPFCAIGPAFLRCAHDKMVDAPAMPRRPVCFDNNRGGLLQADGTTHAGAFGFTYLAALPGTAAKAPADGAESMLTMKTAAAYGNGPIAFRYRRVDAADVLPLTRQPIAFRKGCGLRKGRRTALLAAQVLSTTVANARFAKSLGIDLILQLHCDHDVRWTVGESCKCSFRALALHAQAENGALKNRLDIRTLVLPDAWFCPMPGLSMTLSFPIMRKSAGCGGNCCDCDCGIRFGQRCDCAASQRRCG